MANYEAREEKLLGKIANRLSILDETLDKMDDTDSHVKHYFEQEKALHEIRRITREEAKIEKDEQKAAEKSEKQMADWIDDQVDTVKKINERIDTLDHTLDELNEGENSKVKSYMEQKKAISEIKSILKEANKLDK